MKIKQIIKVAEAIDDSRKMPCDMHELGDTKYFSHSKQDFITIADMDIVHLVRAFKSDRHRLNNQFTDKDLVKQNDVLINTNKVLGRQHDIWKEKAMNMIEQSTHTELQLENQRLVQQLEADEHNVGKLDDTVPKATYQVMWDNCQSLQNQAVKNRNENKTLKKQVEHWKKLAEDNFISSINDSETSDTWKDRYEHELKMAEYWKDLWNTRVDNLRELPKGCGYAFSEIPNDTDGQEFVDTMKKYFNKKSYKMRVRGQHIKPELRGTGATAFGQNKDESTHLRVYIDVK